MRVTIILKAIFKASISITLKAKTSTKALLIKKLFLSLYITIKLKLKLKLIIIKSSIIKKTKQSTITPFLLNIKNI